MGARHFLLALIDYGAVRVVFALVSFQHLQEMKLNSIQVGGSLTFH